MRLALAGIVLLAPLLGAGSCAPDPVHLSPIPAPAAVVVRVPTFVSLPDDATTPCPEPQRREIATDVQLLETADAFKVAMRCNAAKLAAIRSAQPKEPTP